MIYGKQAVLLTQSGMKKGVAWAAARTCLKAYGFVSRIMDGTEKRMTDSDYTTLSLSVERAGGVVETVCIGAFHCPVVGCDLIDCLCSERLQVVSSYLINT